MNRGNVRAWLGFLLLLLLIPIISAYYLLTSAQISDPVRFHVVMKADFEGKVRFLAIGRSDGFYAPHVDNALHYWLYRGGWIHFLALQLSDKTLNDLQRLEITVGDDETQTYDGDEVRRWQRMPPRELLKEDLYSAGDALVLVPNVFGRSSVFPWVRHARTSADDAVAPWNWPGDAAYVRAIVQASLIPCLILLTVAWVFVQYKTIEGRAWCFQVLMGEKEKGLPFSGLPTPALNGKQVLCSPLTGLLFLACVLALLEVLQPYYFTQDDNLIESLPMILVGCRGIWQGEFPEYNPYLFMGAPLASLGMYALTYPPLPLSYAIARHILGQEYLTLEVFAILHLIIGFFATRLLAIRLGMGGLPANLTALSCVLSGPNLIMGRCWFNFIPVLTWLPILFLGLERLCRGREVSWRWIIGMGLATGLTFHVGFSQAAIYLNSFLCLAVLFLTAVGSLPWRRALALVPALIIGAGLALPLVYQQWLAAADVERFDIDSRGIAMGLPGMLLPYPVVQTSPPYAMGNVHVEYLGQLYFFGGLLAWLFFFQAIGWLCLRILSYAKREETYATPQAEPVTLSPCHPVTLSSSSQVWTFCAVCALWLGLGSAGVLWTLIAKLPVIGFINRYPMRVLPFVVFFASLSGGLVLERLLRRTRSRPRMEAIVAGPALALLVWHAGHCCTAFYTYDFRPYPELPAEMQTAFWNDDQPTGRVASWTRHRSSDSNFALLLPLDLPAVYGLPAWDGYNPLINGKQVMRDVYAKMENDPARTLRAYGIRWNLTHDPGQLPPLSTVRSVAWMEEAADKMLLLRKLPNENLAEIYHKDGIVVSHRPRVDALVFAVEEPERCLPLKMHCAGLNVFLRRPAEDTKVVVNFLYYPWMETSVDGRAVACRPDEWNRVTFDVPAGSQVLEVRYRPPWARGVWLGLGTLVVGLALAAAAKRQKLHLCQ